MLYIDQTCAIIENLYYYTFYVLFYESNAIYRLHWDLSVKELISVGFKIECLKLHFIAVKSFFRNFYFKSECSRTFL